MQKVLRQNLLARNQNIRVARKKQFKELKKEWAKYDQGKLVVDRSTRDAIKDERRARREDWIQGPLAPNRNVGLKRGTYGTVHQALTRGPELPKRERYEGDEVLFAVGDRVCVVRGSSKGRIGRIKEISLDRAEVLVEGVNAVSLQSNSLPDCWKKS